MEFGDAPCTDYFSPYSSLDFDDDDRLLFCEGYNQGVEAMRSQVLTMLDKMKEE